MAISLSDGTTIIELPQDMLWDDEFDWAPIEQDQEYSLTGALIIQVGEKLKGRPITLVGGDNACWVPRSTIKALHAMASDISATLTLTYHDTDYTVAFRQGDRPIETKQVQRMMNPGDDHKYTITLRLLEVA